MAMTKTNNANAAINNQSNAASQADEKPPAISAAEKKVAEAAQRDRWVGLAAKILLLLYVLITAAVAASSVWNNRTSNDLRAAEGVLNDLQKEKIRTDAATKTEIETQRVREDASADLTKAKADLTTEQTKLAEEQRKTADAQRAADEARLALQKHVKDVAARQKNRHLRDEQRARLLDTLRRGPKAKVLVFWNGDEETRDFAEELNSLLIDAGWQTLITEAPNDMPQDRGMWIAYKQSAFAPANLLHNALTRAGFNFRFFASSDSPIFDETIVLGVALRT